MITITITMMMVMMMMMMMMMIIIIIIIITSCFQGLGGPGALISTFCLTSQATGWASPHPQPNLVSNGRTPNLPTNITPTNIAWLGNSLWTWEFHPLQITLCLSETLRNPQC